MKRGKPIPPKRHSTKSKYDKEHTANLIHRAALLGMKNQEIADLLDIKLITLEHWILKKPEVKEAINAGRNMADTDVAMSLYKMACGRFTTLDTHITVINGQIIQTPVIKQYPPNITAAIFWLKNRTRNMEAPWVDVNKQEITQTNVNTISLKDLEEIDLSELTEDELKLVQTAAPSLLKRINKD